MHMVNEIWIDGVATPVSAAYFEICIGEHPWFTKGDRKIHGPDHRAVFYSLLIVVDENSGEDGTPCPSSESLPVWSAAGGRHPSLAELAQMTIPDGAGWNARFGNDAQTLRENRLQFGGWSTPTQIRLTWTARYEDDPEWFIHPHGPVPGLMRYQGEAQFLGIKIHVDHAEDADRVFKSIWGLEQLEAMERVDLDRLVLCELRPNLQRFLPDGIGRWLASLPFFRQLRRHVLPVVYRPTTRGLTTNTNR